MMVPVHNCKNSSASEKVVTPILSEYHTIEGVRSVKIREMKLAWNDFGLQKALMANTLLCVCPSYGQ